MSLVLLTPLDDHWVLPTGASLKLQAAIKQGVPANYRRYNDHHQTWVVYWKHLKWLVDTARRLGHSLDWSSLPSQWQLAAAGAEVGPYEDAPSAPSAYSELYVTPNAPVEVIKAAYRALVVVHHPDKGGDPAKFRSIQEAYETITGRSGGL